MPGGTMQGRVFVRLRFFSALLYGRTRRSV
jgi:hypothetical protein